MKVCCHAALSSLGAIAIKHITHPVGNAPSVKYLIYDAQEQFTRR